MLLKLPISLGNNFLQIRKLCSSQSRQGKSKILKNISQSLFLVGQHKYDIEKTATNVYEHFNDPTSLLETNKSENIKDFCQMSEVIINFGSPEMADQMSGSIYMHASLEEDNCSKCLKLCDQIPTFCLNDLKICVSLMNWWSTEAIHSLAVKEMVKTIDVTCVDRLSSLHFSLQDQMRMSFQWQSLMFSHSSKFTVEFIKSSSSFIPQSSLPVIVSYLFILSLVEEERLVNVDLGGGREIANKIVSVLPLLTEPELIASYSGLKALGDQMEDGVKDFLISKYGYKL